MPEFKIAIVRLYEEFMTLANKLLEIMGHALKLDVCEKLWLIILIHYVKYVIKEMIIYSFT